VAYPCEETALEGAIDAGTQGLIVPILVGPSATIREIAKAKGINLGNVEIVDVPDSRASAAKAVELVRQGKAIVDEGQSALGRSARQSGQGDGPSHRPSSRLSHGRRPTTRS
jgi:phosphotransacetylase